MLGIETMREELHALRTKSTKAYNVNFFVHKPPAPDEAREQAWRAALAPYFTELQVDPASTPASVARLPFDWEADRKSTRLNSSHLKLSRMPSSA